MPTASELRTLVEAEFPNWLEKQNSLVVARSLNVLSAWNDGDSSKKLSVGRYQSYIAQFNLHNIILDSFSGGDTKSRLGLATELASREFLYAVAVLGDNTNCAVLFSDYANTLAQLITVGWREKAELYARHGLAQLQLHGIQRGRFKGGALAQGQSVFRYPYFMMDLVKDWLHADKVSTDTPFRGEIIGDLGGWEELLANWREPNQDRFDKVLSRAADYHVAQSHDMIEEGHDEDPNYRLDHFEVEKDTYWIFPVLLLCVLRLREWEGLTNPRPSHDLFWVSSLGQLPEVPPQPRDEFFDAVEARFRALYPNLPSPHDLPGLRAEQGG